MRVVLALLCLVVFASAAPDATPDPSVLKSVETTKTEVPSDMVEAKYDDEDFFDPKKPPMFESKKWEEEAAPNAQPGDAPDAFIQQDERVYHNTLQPADLPAEFQEAGYDDEEFFSYDPSKVNVALLEAPVKMPPQQIVKFFEVLTPDEHMVWPEARYEDDEEEPRFRATPASAFRDARKKRAARNSLSPVVEADASYADAFRLMQRSRTQHKQDPALPGAVGDSQPPIGETPPSLGGTDPNVLGMPTYTGQFGYPVPVNSFVSKGVASPYYGVPVTPMIPQYQAPFMQSPPVNFYSDGTRYPMNMGHFDAYPKGAARR